MPNLANATNVRIGATQVDRVYLGTVKVWPIPVTAPVKQLVYSVSADMSNLQPLAGTTVAGGIAVLLEPTDGVSAVDFYIDGIFERREQSPPLSLKGDVNGTSANLLDTVTMTNGSHTIDADVTTSIGTTRYSAVFTVDNASSPGLPPATPAGLNATAGDVYVDLSWVSVSEATGYRIYRDGVQVYDGTTAAWRDTVVTAGTAYSYVVSAYNSFGESSQSQSVAATPTGTTSPKLSWSPPTGSSWTELTVPSSGGTLTLESNKNYRLKAPSVIDGTHVNIVLGSNTNVVWIGGHIRKGGAFDAMKKSTYDTPRRGIRISDGGNSSASGTVHLEGLKFEGYFSDPIQIAIRKANSTKVQIQNMDMRTAYVWGVNDKNSYDDLHGDVIQCWGGPTTLLVDGLVALHATYQGFYWDPGDGRPLPTGIRSRWVARRVYIKGDNSYPGSDTHSYLLTNRQSQFTNILNDRVYWDPASNNTNSVTDSYAKWPSEGLTKGAPPNADFDIGQPGLAYISPGYIS